jgi:hypothetical protein
MNQKHKLMSLAAGAVVLCGLGVAFTKNVFAAQPQITVTSLTRSITVENNITLNSSKHYAIDQINHSSLEANEKDEAIKFISNASSSDEVKEIYNKYSKIELDRITAKRDAEEAKRKAEEEAKKKAEEERLAQEAAKKAEEERIAKEKAAQEAAAAQAAQAANEQPQSYSAAPSNGATISLSQFMFDGVVYWGGYKFTYYSQSVLPGGGLSIPGRHVNADGYVADGDGYIVLAGSAPKGTVYDTPFGYKGKIYDRGTYGNHLDVYIR